MKIGNKDITNIKYGNKLIVKVYNGNNLVWEIKIEIHKSLNTVSNNGF